MRPVARHRSVTVGVLLSWTSLLFVLSQADASAAAGAAGVLIVSLLVGACLVVAARVVADARPHPPLIAAERRLRGRFRRQSAPDTPGCPRRPRAPGRVVTA